MEIFLFELGALLILIPVIYFLPLGISTKGKMIIVVLAFFISNIGIIALDIIPIWQILLLLSLMVFVIAYLTEKRLGRILFTTNLKEEAVSVADVHEDVDMIDNRETFVDSENSSTIMGLGSIDQKSKDEMNFNIEEFNSHTEDEQTFSIQDQRDQLPVLEVVPEPDDEKGEQDLLDEDIIEEIDFNFAERNLNVHEDTNNSDLDSNLEELTYMSELEQLLELENDFSTFNKDDEKMETEVNPLTTDFLADLDDLESFLNNTNNSLTTSSIIEPADKVESLVELETVVQGTERAVEMESTEETGFNEFLQTEKEVAYSLQQMDGETETINQGVIWQEQLFDTMVSQIAIQRKYLTEEEYEYLIKEQLSDDLPLQIYYMFATLLIHHYLRINDNFKLEKLLVELKEKYRDYPVLEMELNYIYQLNK